MRYNCMHFHVRTMIVIYKFEIKFCVAMHEFVTMCVYACLKKEYNTFTNRKCMCVFIHKMSTCVYLCYVLYWVSKVAHFTCLFTCKSEGYCFSSALNQLCKRPTL